jgi:hypothetical protein
MRILIATAIAATGVIVAMATAALASPPVPATIEQCAQLLPKGKVYTFEIKGRVDTTGTSPELSGEMSVSDGTEVDRSEETAAFGQCMAGLIK